MTDASGASGVERPIEPCARPMRWWDVEALLMLERNLFGADAWSAETWWAELAQPGRWYLVVDGAEPGVVTAYAGVAVGGNEADVMTVAVAPSEQGAGLGARLVERLVRIAAEQGANQLLLEVRADNLVAQRLYERLGFDRIAVRRGYYRTADGSVDAWVLRRRPLAEEPPDSLHR